MPYEIIKSGRYWYVVTTRTGHVHSKKGFKTKGEANRQLKAININYTGGSFVGDVASNLIGRFSGIRDDYAPSIRNYLKSHGSDVINGLTIFRAPVPDIFGTILNVVSFGQFKKLVDDKGIDKLFHLYLKVSFVNTPPIKVEKNDVIAIKPWKDSDDKGEHLVVEIPHGKVMTLNDFLNNAKAMLGNNYFKYDAFNALNGKGTNCQGYIDSLLSSNGLLNSSYHTFIFQDLADLAKQLPSANFVAKSVTNLAGRVDTFLHGKGLLYQNTIGY